MVRSPIPGRSCRCGLMRTLKRSFQRNVVRIKLNRQGMSKYPHPIPTIAPKQPSAFSPRRIFWRTIKVDVAVQIYNFRNRGRIPVAKENYNGK
jgi:hypothetical protein